MTDVRTRLAALADPAYADFQARLIPGVPRARILGVRVPALRALAAQIACEPGCEAFLAELPHRYYDEDMLHSVLLSRLRDPAACAEALARFLPYVDNWAVCDTLAPRALAKNKPETLRRIRGWAASPHVYTCRFGVKELMNLFLDADFRPEYLEIPAALRRDEYYVQMMVAWFFATALAKQWEAAIPYLEERRLTEPVRRMAVRKACESFRVPDERKAYLRTL